MLPCFNYLWDLFYIDKVKTIPSNIGDLLTEVGLAFWIMDDGGLGSNGTLNLHTDSYILTEVNLLIDVLKRNFDINSRISIKRPGQWIIVIPKKEVPKVAELTIAHMHPSMLYKIAAPRTTKQNPPAYRRVRKAASPVGRRGSAWATWPWRAAEGK